MFLKIQKCVEMPFQASYELPGIESELNYFFLKIDSHYLFKTLPIDFCS